MAVPRPTGSRTRLAVLVLASVTLLTVGLRDVPIVRDTREAVGGVLDPVSGVVGAVTSPVRNAWHGVTDYDDVRAERDELQDRLAELETGEVRESNAERQLAELTEAVQLDFVGDIPTVAARVSSGPRSNFSHAVEIDKGSDDGVVVGMPVAAGAGLVGRVTQVTGSTARVELVTDPEFRVGVRLATTGDLGTARGQGRDDPLVVDSSIGPRVEVAPGTGVVTSGVDRSAFPPGIPIGAVTSTREGSGGLSLELEVDPLVDVEQLSYMSVLQWQG
jgi:rod shape-determining protein MreC